MSERSSKVARYFQKLGMKRGDAILIMLPNVLPLRETILVHEYSRFSAKESLEVLSRCQVNTLCAPPTAWCMLILENLGQKAKLGSMGRALLGYVPVLLNEKEEEALKGEIALKLTPELPLGLMQGDQDAPERTAKVTAQGYYRTGDDVFRSSDYRIRPIELESVLLEHDAVAEAAIIPGPDDVRLYVPKAIVVLKPGFAPHAVLAQQILDFCKEKLAPYKRIRRLEFADLPKTISGKIRRVQWRAIENERIKNKQRGPQEYWLNER